MATRTKGLLVTLAVTGMLMAGLTGCAPARSVSAFCSTMEEHKAAYLGQMEAAQGAGVSGLITAVSAVGDLKLMWKELADVAPSDIQGDVEAVSEAWQKQEDNAGAGDWMSAIATALFNSGSMSRVDAYVRENCDGDYGVEASSAAGLEDSADAALDEEVVAEDYLRTITAAEAGGLIADWDQYAVGPSSVIHAAGENYQEETTRQFRMVAVPADEPAVDTTAMVQASSPTGTISGAVYAAQSNTDEEPGFAVAYVDESPAAGAQPHRATVMIQRYGPDGLALGGAAPVVDDYDGKYLVSVWLVGETVVLEYTDPDYNHLLIGVGPNGAIAWQTTTFSAVYYARDGVLVTDIPVGDDADLAGIDAATGASRWTMSAAGFDFRGNATLLGSGYVATTTATTEADSMTVVFDSSNGEVVLQLPGSEAEVFYDASTERFISVGRHDGASESSLRVADAAGSTVFTIGPEDFEALGRPRLVGAAGGVVWVDGEDGLDLFEETTGEQNPLVSRLATGSIVAYPARTEGSVSLFSNSSGYLIAIHQNTVLTNEIATALPSSVAAG